MNSSNLVKLDEPFYTAEQIVVPPELPEILKQFTKAAIKTQPPDLLEWACNYFRAKSTGQRLPVKERLEVLPDEHDDLTLGLLKILHHEIGHKRVLNLSEIQDRWTALGLSPDKLDEKMEDMFQNLCLVLTKEPEGNNALVSFETFKDAYEFVATTIEPVPDNVKERFLSYMADVAAKQNDMVHPGDITYRDCPPMRKL